MVMEDLCVELLMSDRGMNEAPCLAGAGGDRARGDRDRGDWARGDRDRGDWDRGDWVMDASSDTSGCKMASSKTSENKKQLKCTERKKENVPFNEDLK